MAGQPFVYRTIPEVLDRHAARDPRWSIGLRNVQILYNGSPSGFDEFERHRSEDDGASGFEVFATAYIRVKDLSKDMAAQNRQRTKSKQALVAVRVKFLLAEVAYVVEKYMEKNVDTMIIISTLGALCATENDPWRYWHIEGPVRALECETYLNSRLTLERYNSWRFIWCACKGYRLTSTLKQRAGPRRTIEWLVDAFFQMYGETHDGSPRGHPVRRADVRSMLAMHALWLRPRLRRLIKPAVWDEWCDEEIPRVRAAAARQGIVWGRMRALDDDPRGRRFIHEDPNDPTTTMRADERRRLDDLTREAGGGEPERDRSPVRERRKTRTPTQQRARRRPSPSPPRGRSPPRSRRESRTSTSSRTDARPSLNNRTRASALSRSPSLGRVLSDDDEVQIIPRPISVINSPPQEVPSSPASVVELFADEGSPPPPPESPSARPKEEPWELLVLAEFPFLANLPELPVGHVWTCQFEDCNYKIDMYDPQANAEQLLLKNKLWIEFSPAQDDPAHKTRSHKGHRLNAKQERYRRFMQEHHLGHSLGCEEERERLFEVLVYMHWARDLFYRGYVEGSRFFFESGKAKCDAAADPDRRTLSPVV